jgi:hypothetical protein
MEMRKEKDLCRDVRVVEMPQCSRHRAGVS